MHIGVFPNAHMRFYIKIMHMGVLVKCLYALLSISAFGKNAYMYYLILKYIWAFAKRRYAPPFPINSTSLLQQSCSFSHFLLFFFSFVSPSMLLLFFCFWPVMLLFLISWFLVIFIL